MAVMCRLCMRRQLSAMCTPTFEASHPKQVMTYSFRICREKNYKDVCNPRLVLQARPQPKRGSLSVSCVIRKAICAGVDWVWLARLSPHLLRAERTRHYPKRLYPLKVLERDGAHVKAHYVVYSSTHDEWRDVKRLQPPKGKCAPNRMRTTSETSFIHSSRNFRRNRRIGRAR